MHQPVLLQSVIDGLNLSPGLTVVDGTINGGGHAAAIAKVISPVSSAGGPTGYLIGIDRDARAIIRAKKNLASVTCRLDLVTGSYADLAEILHNLGVSTIDRALLDLGFSSNQVEESGRGFSFLKDEPLLMTYEYSPRDNAETAESIVNSYRMEDLAKIFSTYGDESFARPIAKEIARTRRRQRISTTTELVAAITRAVPAWYQSPRRRLHPATKTFQALRIVVNDEYGALAKGLEAIWQKLTPGGRAAIITFHSGEARIVKSFFRGKEIIEKAKRATYQEVRENPRSRSAVLRIVEKS